MDKKNINTYLVEANMKTFNRFMTDDNGATLIEYALLVALIAVVAIAALTTVGGKVATEFNNIAKDLK